MMESVLNRFDETNPDIRVKRIHIGGDYNTKLQTMMAANRSPDVFYLLSADCVDYMSKGALTDIAPMLEKSKVIKYEDFFPNTVSQFKIDNRLYALSFDWSPCVVFYNKTFFDQSYVPYPKDDWTWDEFLDTAKKLTVTDDSGRIVRYGTLHVIGFSWRQWIMQNGGRTFNDTLDRCVLDSPEAIEATKFEYDLYAKYRVAPQPNDAEVDHAMYFMAGKAAMVFSYRWFITFLDPLKRYEWRIASIPRGKVNVNFAGAVGFAMSSQCKQKKAAWRLIEYLCGPDGQSEFVKCRWGVPTLKELAADVKKFEDPAHPNYNYKLFAEEAKHSIIAEVSPYIPEQKLGDLCMNERDKLFMGKQTVEQTLKSIVAQTNRIMLANKKAQSDANARIGAEKGE